MNPEITRRKKAGTSGRPLARDEGVQCTHVGVLVAGCRRRVAGGPNVGCLHRQPSSSSSGETSYWATRGFTLVELLVSLMIVGLLAAIAILNMTTALEKARVTRAIAEIRGMEKELAKYELDNGGLPDTLTEIGWGERLDPWGSLYQYLNFATVAAGNGSRNGNGNGNAGGVPGRARKDKSLVPLNSTYDLYSMGRDGKSQTPLTAQASWDDVVRAGDGAFVGLATDF